MFAIGSEPLAAPKLFDLGPLGVTNSMLFALAAAAVTLMLLGMAAARSQVSPRSKLAFAMESLVDAIFGVAIDSFNDRKKALKHLPFLATLFCFIFVGNLSGLIPGIDSIYANVDGEHVSLMRSFTTDLNATLAMAVFTIGSVQFYAISELGIMGHLKHYFTNQPWKPINMFIGINEVFGEILRIVTLSMRLFGVIYAGEVLISTIAQLTGNFAWFTTIPTILLEVFFSAIQAYVFMMLTTTYLSIAMTHSENEQKEGGNVKTNLQTAT